MACIGYVGSLHKRHGVRRLAEVARVPGAGGASDVVRHLETGLLYDPTDPVGLADAVMALVADKRRQLLGDYAREVIARRTWRDAVDELVDQHYAPLLEVPVVVAA